MKFVYIHQSFLHFNDLISSHIISIDHILVHLIYAFVIVDCRVVSVYLSCRISVLCVEDEQIKKNSSNHYLLTEKEIQKRVRVKSNSKSSTKRAANTKKMKQNNLKDLRIDERLTRRRAEFRFIVSSDLTFCKKRFLRDDIKVQSRKKSFQYSINFKIARVRLLKEKKTNKSVNCKVD